LHECNVEIEQAAAAYLATAPEPPAAMFDSTYARMPVDLVEQATKARAPTAGTA